MIGRLAGIARGVAAGAVGGAVWALVETALGWWAGSVVPHEVARQLGALDVLVGAIVGGTLGLAVPRVRLRSLALALVGAYGFLRVYAPPGFGAEAVYTIVFAAVALVIARRARTDIATVGFALLVALGAVGVLLGDAWLEDTHAAA